MVQQLHPPTKPAIDYPDSDGQSMSDNTLQFEWIVTIKENLERLFADDPQVFVAGDLLWYPVEGNNQIRRAPDAMVVFGRPKGYRGSYKQWEEAGIAPQVVFEILSPSNTLKEMAQKQKFYDQYGVEEYYIYDPDAIDLLGWIRQGQALEIVETIQDWQSPRLGIRFHLMPERLQIFTPAGEPFLTFVELDQRYQAAKQRAEAAEAQVQLLQAKLRELGIDPNL